MTKLLEIDPTGFEAHFGKEPFAVRHNLVEHELLTVERVAQLADFLPESSVEHNLGNVDKFVPGGEAPRLDQTPGEVARNIETNGSWMVLKNIEQDAEYKALLDESLDVVTRAAEAEGGMAGREGFIFLAAPNSMTPAHIDPEHNFLLQIRGTKQMNVGSFPDPLTEQLALEQALGGGHRNVGWEPKDPRAFELSPGDGVYVQPHAPHWVQNGPTVSVSLSITFATPASEQARRVHSINARLRRLGLKPRPPGARPRADRRKAAGSRALGKVRRAV
jgi:hypothetical protein